MRVPQFLKSFSSFVILVCAIALQAQIVPVYPHTPLPTAENGVAVNETGSLWFVQLASPPTADGTAIATVRQEKSSFRKAASAAGVKYRERFAYDVLFNGLAIQLDPAQIGRLSRISGVSAVYPIHTYAIPKTSAISEPDMMTALAMTGADIAQNSLGLSGKGVKVGIIDTGIDYAHPDLGGDGVANDRANFPTSRVITGWDFVGDAYDADTNPNPVPGPEPYDCAGHGTHVAGIVGANGLVKGVAPNVSFGAYRVFGCSGTTGDDIMIAAMERALKDGMQVVNMSIGSAFGWPQWPTAMAATRLVNKGVVVVTSIGNNGTSGLWAAGAPGLGSKVIGTASFDNTHMNLAAFSYSPANTQVGYVVGTPAPPAPLSGTSPLARSGTAASTDDACTAFASGAFSGKTVLIRRGSCTFYIKAKNAMDAGAAGVILYNNVPGLITPNLTGAAAINIPVVSISAVDGEAIDSTIAAGTSTMTWTSEAISLPNATGGLLSSFSSFGLSPDLALKPDIGAPGGYVRSTYPLALGTYANLSGTSMSSPHVAGAVALLLEAFPHTPSQAVRDILQNRAEPAPWFGNPGLGYLDNVNRQGAGMLQIDKSILSTTRISPGKLSVGALTSPVTQYFTITNNGRASVTYDLGNAGALANGPEIFLPSYYAGFANVIFTKGGQQITAVTIPALGSATIGAKFSPPVGLPDLSTFGGYIVVSPRSGGEALTVPYAGILGDYQSLPSLAPTPYGFPWLASLVGSSYVKQPTGATYTMQGTDVPFFLLHFDHQATWLRMEVFEANSGRAWHRALTENYLPRNSTSTGFFSFAWDGSTVNGNSITNVPNGQYVVRVSVLKPLGDASNPSDVETWTSPVITVARP